MAIEEVKKCAHCNKILKGRIDKKFCDDACRNNFNNGQNSIANNYVRNIINALKKNRRILETVILQSEKDTTKISKSKLLQQGFDITLHTNTYTTKAGGLYLFSFEYGIMAIENDWYIVVKNKTT
jgi:hypothetical protein